VHSSASAISGLSSLAPRITTRRRHCITITVAIIAIIVVSRQVSLTGGMRHRESGVSGVT